MTDLAKDLENYDRLFADWRKKNPGGTFSDFSLARSSAGLRKGVTHATLGLNLDDGKTWWKHGIDEFDLINDCHQLTASTKICEYGCGSLRIGKHFIDGQNTGCFFGIDKVPDFIDLSADRLSELCIVKKPTIGTIDQHKDCVVAAGVDILYSFSVTRHIHPDEEQVYYRDIQDIVWKKGAVAMVDVHLSDQPQRFARSGWSWPMSHYLDCMSEFELMENRCMEDNPPEDRGSIRHLLVFRRL